jgi:small ubiquitin-related modifier
LDFNDRSARRALTLYELKECFEDEYDKSIWTYPEDRSLKRKRAVVEDEPSAASEEKLNIRIRDQTGEETWFKVKPTTPLQKVFNAYATRKGVAVTHLRFLFDGARYFGAQTPADIGMENRDQLDCMLEQGGC